jgi:hypothetical protein
MGEVSHGINPRRGSAVDGKNQAGFIKKQALFDAEPLSLVILLLPKMTGE